MMGILCIGAVFVVLFKIHFVRMMGCFCRGASFMVYVERFSIYWVDV